jgi:hypothetical protein
MKKKALFVFILTCCTLFFQTGSFGTENKTLNLPSVFVLESRFKFGPVLEGTEITHDFIVQNRGTAPTRFYRAKQGNRSVED